jgi:hypothetical protein
MTVTMTMVLSENNDHMSIGNQVATILIQTMTASPPERGTTLTTTAMTMATTMATTRTRDDHSAPPGRLQIILQGREDDDDDDDDDDRR